MGLPRSNLVKSKSSEQVVGPAAPSFNPPFAAPFSPDRTQPLPFGSFSAPVVRVAIGETTQREPLNTSPDGVEVDISLLGRGPYASSISTNELLERAAALGPARMTWESIVLPGDPILDEKRQPHVAERRERFTRMVKIGLGACLAVCVIALGVSALSGDASAASASAAPTAALGKTVPSKGIVPIEPLDGARAPRAKAVRRVAPAVATAAIGRPKRR